MEHALLDMLTGSSNPAAGVTVFTSEAKYTTNKSYVHTAVPLPVSFPEFVLRCNRFLVEVFQFVVPHLLVLICSGKTVKQNEQI